MSEFGVHSEVGKLTKSHSPPPGAGNAAIDAHERGRIAI